MRLIHTTHSPVAAAVSGDMLLRNGDENGTSRPVTPPPPEPTGRSVVEEMFPGMLSQRTYGECASG